MKQLLFFLITLLPCLALAQYPSNANQKITLGEQTTADGLVYRGLAADTTRKATVDTIAYMLLDTATNIMWHYKKATSNAWLRLNLLPSDTTSMLTNYYRSGRALGTPLSGTLTNATGLPIGSGLTGLGAANRIPYATSATGLTTNNKFLLDPTGNKLIIGKNDSLDGNPNYTINMSGSEAPSPILGFRLYNSTLQKVSVFRYTNNDAFIFQNNDNDNGLGAIRFFIGSSSGEEILTVTRTSPSNGKVGINISSPSQALHVVGNARISGLAGTGSRAVNADANGVLSATSSILIKENIENINYGLSDVLKLKPVIFNYIDKNKWGEGKDLGFVAEDIMNVIPEATGVMENSSIYFDLQKLVPVLTKAIQEQQVLIKSLEQRIINLENK
jgi:hypothetical protein